MVLNSGVNQRFSRKFRITLQFTAIGTCSTRSENAVHQLRKVTLTKLSIIMHHHRFYLN